MEESSADPQALRPVADTSYLMPFGINGGRALLRALHPSGLRSPMIVKDELAGLSNLKDQLRRDAARALATPKSPPVVYEALQPEHAEFKEELLDRLHAHAVARGKATGPR